MTVIRWYLNTSANDDELKNKATIKYVIMICILGSYRSIDTYNILEIYEFFL